MSKTKLSAAMKNAIIKVVIQQAAAKTVDREAVKARFSKHLKDIYEAVYDTEEKRKAVQLLLKCSLVDVRSGLSLDSVMFHNVGPRTPYDSMDTSGWYNVFEAYQLDKTDRPYSIQISLDQKAETLYPNGLMHKFACRFGVDEKLKALQVEFQKDIGEFYRTADRDLESVRSCIRAIKSFGNSAALIEALPELKELVESVVSSAEAKQLPAIVGKEELCSFLKSISPLVEAEKAA